MTPILPAPLREPLLHPDGKTLSLLWWRWISQLVQTFNSLMNTGTTAQRPNPAPFVGFMYFDTTLGKPVWAKTLTSWVDATGASA